MSASLTVASVALAASVIAAWTVPPPAHRLTRVAVGLASIAVVDCVVGALRGTDGRVLLAVAVVASAIATWLLRAPADDDDDGGWPPPDGPEPDTPDPGAFDWDEFERSAREPTLWPR